MAIPKCIAYLKALLLVFPYLVFINTGLVDATVEFVEITTLEQTQCFDNYNKNGALDALITSYQSTKVGTDHPSCLLGLNTAQSNVCGLFPIPSSSYCYPDVSYCGCDLMENTWGPPTASVEQLFMTSPFGSPFTNGHRSQCYPGLFMPDRYGSWYNLDLKKLTTAGSCIPTIASSPSSLASCSCHGKCMRATTPLASLTPDFNYPFALNVDNPHMYAPPLGRTTLAGNPTSGAWSTCVCHHDYYGERCQYKKGPDDIQRLASGAISISNFPFLPWYQTSDEKQQWKTLYQQSQQWNGQPSSFAGPSPLCSGNTMGSLIKTAVARGQDKKTIWAWPDLKHSCPYGMIARGSYSGSYVLASTCPTNGIGSLSARQIDTVGESEVMEQLAAKQDRSFIQCMCDPDQGRVGCSGRGTCESFINGQNGVTLDWTGITKKDSYPITYGDFPRASWNSDNPVLLPTKWSTCRCDPDFDGLYCEQDNRFTSLCGGLGFPVDDLVAQAVPGYNPADDPGDCTCDAKNLKSIHVNIPPYGPGVPPEHPIINSVANILNGRVRTNVIYTLQTNRGTMIRRKDLCIEDKSLTVCQDRGVYNSIFLRSGANPAPRTIGCECSHYSDYPIMNARLTSIALVALINNQTLAVFNNNTNLMNGIAAGPGCFDTCRTINCNGRGICQYIARTTLFARWQSQNQQILYNWDINGKKDVVDSSTGFWPTEDAGFTAGLVFPYVVDPDTCYCDVGWKGAHCELSTLSGDNCNGFADNLYVPGTSCEFNCKTSISTYDKVLARCVGNCPLYNSIHPLEVDQITPPNFQVCGGPERGTCDIYNPITSQRSCTCKNGYDHPELGCSLSICLRYKGQVCNGHGTCMYMVAENSPRQDGKVARCFCDQGWMGDACQEKIGQYACARGSQQVNNRNDWLVS